LSKCGTSFRILPDLDVFNPRLFGFKLHDSCRFDEITDLRAPEKNSPKHYPIYYSHKIYVFVRIPDFKTERENCDPFYLGAKTAWERMALFTCY